MTLSTTDRLFETTISTGSGPFTLQGAVSGFQGFAALGNGKKTTFYIDDADSSGVVQKWMDVIGTITVTGGVTSLSVDQVLASSNNGSLVNFGAGTKNVRGGLGAKVLPITDENLNNVRYYGALSGTANEHAVTLPYAPLAYSDGMMIVYRVAVPNTTAGVTVNVNGLGARALKVNGADPGAGLLIPGLLVQAFYNAALNAFTVANAPFLGSVVPLSMSDQTLLQHGQCRLVKSGANLVLQRYNGKWLTINRQTCSIPAEGVSLAPVALTADTLYYIYARDANGDGIVDTLEASTIGRATDETTGVEIKSGDATRTLVGMAWATGATTWGAGACDVANWFTASRRPVSRKTSFSANRTTTSTTAVELNSEIRNGFLTWGDASIKYTGATSSSVANGQSFTLLNVDGRASYDGSSISNAASGYMNANCAADVALIEGRHYATLFGSVGSGTGTWVCDAGGIAGAGNLYVTVAI